MKKLFKKINDLNDFLDSQWGWFFTNGRKQSMRNERLLKKINTDEKN